MKRLFVGEGASLGGKANKVESDGVRTIKEKFFYSFFDIIELMFLNGNSNGNSKGTQREFIKVALISLCQAKSI